MEPVAACCSIRSESRRAHEVIGATLYGRILKVTRAKDGTVTVGGARVVRADVLAGNGIVHVIDTVVLPR